MSNLLSALSVDRLLELSIRLLAVVAILPVHELAHALVADKLGDTTARRMGRLTLNPLRHLDLLGTVMVLFAGFGWAKPVPVDMRAFKNPKRGMAVVALAGPVSNFLLTMLFLLVQKVLVLVFGRNMPEAVYNVIQIFDMLAYISTALGVFNLLPIPPLDGSRILGLFLPDKLYYGIMRYERIIMLGVFALLFTGVLSGPLSIVIGQMYNLLDLLTVPFSTIINLI